MVEYVITTPDYRAGQAAAWKDFEKDPDSVPNLVLLARLKSREFCAGYCDEWDNFITPVRNRMGVCCCLFEDGVIVRTDDGCTLHSKRPR